MCGICGIFNYKNQKTSITKDLLIKIRDSMIHRGPDDAGMYISPDKKAGLAHRRLSIIDLSEAAHQPMCNEDGTIWITYNGEIYNYREIREVLILKGHKFKSNSDTEAIIHGYEEWGIEGLLKELRGMFAFALYDSRLPDSRLILVRDRFGIKPLYYSYNNSTFLFASEIKAILASRLVSKEIDPQAVVLFLIYGSIPAPKTIYKAISAVEPGHFLIISKKGLKKYRYYNLKDAFLDKSLTNISEEEAIERVHSCLINTIECHLVSDVPVGAFLSGGIDSTAIVALMREVEYKPIKTVSVIFPDTPYDESRYSKLIAQRFNTDHVEIEINSKDLIKHMEKIFYAMDQPTIDGVNTYFVSRATRQAGLKVAMSGVGGDEIFWGYPSFWFVPRLYRWASLPGVCILARPLTSWIANRYLFRKMGKLNYLFQKPSLESAYLAVRSVFSIKDLEKILNPDLFDELRSIFKPTDHIKKITNDLKTNYSITNIVSALELCTYMANQLLRDTDVFSMAHSLEVRVPFVDHTLVELLAKLPVRYKAKKDMPKRMLIKALNNKLPNEIVHRPKMGFTFPFDLWIRNELKELTEEKLNGTSVLNKPYVTKLLKNFYNHKVHWSRVWSLLVLSHWLN